MQGNFSLGLLEIFAYLLPGGIGLSAILYQLFPHLVTQIQKDFSFQIVFLVCSYILGHIITAMSVFVLKLREIVRKVHKAKSREERMSYYLDLRDELHKIFGEKITRGEEYIFSLRLVTDNLPKSSQEIERLYALTLFSRNMAMALIISAILFLQTGILIPLSSIFLSLVFFVRYIQLEVSTSDTVFEAAFAYLRSRDIAINNNDG